MEFLIDDLTSDHPTLTIQDGKRDDVCIQLWNEHKNIKSWLPYLTFLADSHANDMENLLEMIPELLMLPTPTKEELNIYQNLLEGALHWLSLKKEDTIKKGESFRWQPQYDALSCKIFHFRLSKPTQKDHYEISFSRIGAISDILGLYIRREDFISEPEKAIEDAINRSYENNPQNIIRVITNYKYFCISLAYVNNEAKDMFLQVSKALVNLMEQDARLHARRLPEICTFIITNEQDLEEQKFYIHKILQSHEADAEKRNRLQDIMNTLSNHLSSKPQHFTEIISTISAHYLQLYDLDTSVYFWNQARDDNYIFRFFLSLHKHPFRFVAGTVAILFTLQGFVWLHWKMPGQWPSFSGPLPEMGWSLFQFMPVILLILFFGIIFLLLLLIIANIKSKGEQWLMYAQLPFPRIIGAAIVGLFPLLLNDQSWFIGIQSSWMTWIFLSLFTYLLSFTYIFIEVSKTVKSVKGRSRGDTLKTSTRLFWIATFETLIIITMTSATVFSAIKTSLVGINVNGAITIALPPLVNLDIFPLLIILWSGVALFIGSFVQLLWQGERLTESL